MHFSMHSAVEMKKQRFNVGPIKKLHFWIIQNLVFKSGDNVNCDRIIRGVMAANLQKVSTIDTVDDRHKKPA
jgi:hypothetical protein